MVSGQASSAQPITAGVPQGSILGPTLFPIYVSNVDQCLTPERALAPLLMTPHYTACCNQKLLLPRMPPYKMLHGLQEWSERWRVTFEPSKSQQLLCTRSLDPATPGISFGGVDIAQASTLNLLGILFDSKLSFRQHISSTTVRASQRLGLLRRAARILDTNGRLSVYRGFIRPTVRSGAEEHLAEEHPG